MAMRATAENFDVARLMGIDVDRMIMLAFAIGSALAAAAGLLWGSKYGQISPLMGLIPGLKAFVAAVIGGVGSISGAMLGGYVLGLAEGAVRRAVAAGILRLPQRLRVRDPDPDPAGHAERPARPQHRGAGVMERHSGWLAALGAASSARCSSTPPGDCSIPISWSIIAFVGINIILAVSLNITNGFTGLFSLGHPAFMTIGGYVTAILTMPPARKTRLLPDLPAALAALQWPFLPALIAGGLIATLARSSWAFRCCGCAGTIWRWRRSG